MTSPAPTAAARLTPAVRMGLSIAVAVGLYGISFGALAVAAGLSVWQAVALSALMFTGGSQFAFIGVISGGGSLAAATTAASLLGLRNAVYGVQINALLRPRRAIRPLQAHLTIDESTATVVAQVTTDERRRGFWAAGIGVWTLWNLFTLLGALAGERLGDPQAWARRRGGRRVPRPPLAPAHQRGRPRHRHRHRRSLRDAGRGPVRAGRHPDHPRCGRLRGDGRRPTPEGRVTDLWIWVLAACGIAYATKLAGYLVPDSLLDRPWVATVSAGMTVGLLTSLVLVNTVVTGTALVLDARLAALGAAAVALWLRAPYLVVVVVGAIAAALARLAGF